VRYAAAAFSTQRGGVAKGSAGTTGSLWKDLVSKIKSEMAEDKDLQENLKKLEAEKARLAKKKSVRSAVSAAEKIKSRSVETGTKLGGAAAGVAKDVASKSSKTLGSAASRVASSTSSRISSAAQSEVAKSVASTVSSVGSSVKSKVSSSASAASQTGAAKKLGNVGSKVASRSREFAKEYILDPRAEAELSEEYSRGDKAPGVKGSSVDLAELGIESPTEAILNRYRDNPVIKSTLAMVETVRQSDNPVLAGARGAYYSVSERMSELSDRLFPETEAAMCYSEIKRLDPHFDEYRLQERLEKFTLPEVMEALGRNDLDELAKLVSPKLLSVLEQTLPASSPNKIFDTNILHLSPLEMISIKPVEKEPTLFYSFTAQQVAVVRDAAGNVIDGDPDSIQNVQYIWAVQRTKEDPTVWAVVEMQALDPEEALV